MITRKKLKDVTVGELCDDRFQGCYYDDCPTEDCEGRPCQFWIENDESCLVDIIRNQLGERLDDNIPIALEKANEPNDIIEIGEYTFKPVGVDGIYICDQAVFKAPFGVEDCNDWEDSLGKELLKRWFKKNAPAGIKKRFDIDLPTAEEVFSQKMLNRWGGDSVKDLVSKQFPILKDSDERMKEFEGKQIWWWTRSAYAGSADCVWGVYVGGSISVSYVGTTHGFVPVLRRKRKRR